MIQITPITRVENKREFPVNPGKKNNKRESTDHFSARLSQALGPQNHDEHSEEKRKQDSINERRRHYLWKLMNL